MRSKDIILFTLLVVFVSGCGRQIRGMGELLKKPEPGAALFESAENKYSSGRYDEALRLYSSYIDTYSESNLVPAALMKTGMILAGKKEYDKAGETFGRLIRKYPKSIFSDQARIQMLEISFDRGRFKEVLSMALRLSYKSLPRPLALRADIISGDAAMALNRTRDAYTAFSAAYARARESEKKEVTKRLMAVLSRMSFDEIAAGITSLSGRPPAGYLMYRQGLNDLAAGRIGDGLDMLRDFVKRFPGHEFSARAEKEITDLMSVTYFKGHEIGCLLPLSGKYRAIGEKALRGAELAVAEAGKRYAMKPPPGIFVYDSAADPTTARKAVKALSDKRVAAIMGPIVTAEDAADAAQAEGVPIITLTQKPGIAEKGDMVFRNFLTPEMQVEGQVSYTSEILGLKRYAILYPDEAYGKTFMNLFWDAVIRHGGEIVGVEPYNPRRTDFSRPIKKLVGLYYTLPADLKKSPVEDFATEDFLMNETPVCRIFFDGIDQLVKAVAERQPPPGWEEDEYGAAAAGGRKENKKEPIIDFDAVFIPDGPKKAGLIIPQLRYYDINDVFLMGTNLWHSPELIKIARYQIKKAVIPEGFFANSRRKNVVSFVGAFKKTFGYQPGFIEAVSYDSAMILFETLARPEIEYRTALRAAMINMPAFEGVTGKTMFDENGDAKKSIYLLKTRRGSFREISVPQSP
ncbi:MAG: ABC transporter substrate-binding protein [Deltaproteobacteria bacterium]|nr:ABC transporter substrate-binding protein [Deltaproteobacteria bacterium]